jgi:hypothetical protein
LLFIATLERLRSLSAANDPDNVFNQNFPALPTETRAAT